MIATTAKLGGTAGLKELLEAAGASPADTKYTWHNIVSAGDTLEHRGPDLARLVLTLSEAAGTLIRQLDGHPEGLCMCDCCAALAAVEELELGEPKLQGKFPKSLRP